MPDMYTALERSWEIARQDWLPAIPPQQDSFNSYPHLRNLESYLEKIVDEYETLHGPSARPALTPIELYVMLSSILFHDIGRIRTSGGHGKASKVLVKHGYAGLGIPSAELAKTIAPILEFHDLTPDQLEKALHGRELSTVTVSPYGEIRRRVCGSLLLLVDHLDGASTRVVPVYFRPSIRTQTVGAFRRAVRAVVVDLRSQMVKTVLSEYLEGKQKSPAPTSASNLAQFDFELNPGFPKGPAVPSGEADQAIRKIYEVLSKAVPRAGKGRDKAQHLLLKKIQSQASALHSAYEKCEKARGRIFSQNGTGERNPLFDTLKLRQEDPDNYLRLVALGVLRASRKTPKRDENPPKKDTPAEWPRELLLAIIISDTWANMQALDAVKTPLSEVGMPVKAWVLEYNERLYNAKGEETFEPIFQKEYLKRIAKAMWELSTRVFAHSTFSYETLAAEMRGPDVERVRLAVKRLSIISGARDRTRELSRPFWVGQDRWKWDVKPGTGGAAPCVYAAISDLETDIDRQGAPTGGNE
jgi:hypothetical protein